MKTTTSIVLFVLGRGATIFGWRLKWHFGCLSFAGSAAQIEFNCTFWASASAGIEPLPKKQVVVVVGGVDPPGPAHMLKVYHLAK